MIKLNKKIFSLSLATIVTVASLGIGTVYASSAYNQANNKINHLESSFEKNYLGNTNLPVFRQYLSEAKALTAKVTSAADRQKLNNRLNQCEVVIVTTEHVVNMENSMARNYKGTKNLPAFEAYRDKVNASLQGIKNKIVYDKLSSRSYAGSNVIRDIYVVDSSEYIKASNLRSEAIRLFNEGDVTGAKAKANEALVHVWKCNTSLIKDAIASELKDILAM